MKEELILKVAGKAWDRKREVIGVTGSKAAPLMPSWEDMKAQESTNSYVSYMIQEQVEVTRNILLSYNQILEDQFSNAM